MIIYLIGYMGQIGYVKVSGWTGKWVDGWIDKWMGWMDSMDGWTAWLDGQNGWKAEWSGGWLDGID